MKNPPYNQGAPQGKLHSNLSSSELDSLDSRILSAARDCPITLSRISQKMDIPFVECLHRVRRLEDRGLLEKVGEVFEPATMHLYLATRQRVR